MSRTAIKCTCGQRIGQKEVMQTGFYPRMFGPSFIYVRYRCSRCKKLGEQFVKQDEWESGILKDATVETNVSEKERFATLGPIEMKELVDFHRALDTLPNLNDLQAEFGTAGPQSGEGRSHSGSADNRGSGNSGDRDE